MHRLICRLGPVNLYSYGLMLALAFGIGTYIAAFRAQKRGIHRNVIYDLVLWILVSSLAGARLFFVALNLGYFRDHPSEILMVWEGGLVLYGGIIFGFAAAVWYLRRVKVPVWKAADIIAPSLALGVAIGRIGCFLNGCCYGKVSYKWGVCYPSAGSPPAYEEQVRHGLLSGADRCSLPVLPTQLYESLVCLALFGLLLWIGRKKPFFDGFLFWLFILLYSAQRFFMEGIRYYEENFLTGPFTVGQVISIVLFITALAVIALNLRRRNRPA